MATDTPIQAMKKIYESKDKLVSSIASAVKLDSETVDDAKARLKSLSNKKLMRLGALAKEVADRGGKDKVTGAIVAALGRAKDVDYVAKLRTFSNGRLMDMLRVAEKRTKKS
jgi:hypothetical protein